MIQLEDLKPGIQIEGILPQQSVTVIETKWHGSNAIELFCHGKPQPLLDTNMARVLERFFGPRKLVDIRYDPYLQQLSRRVLPQKECKEFNWAILDFASLVCRPRNPLCEGCCLNVKCLYYRTKANLRGTKVSE